MQQPKRILVCPLDWGLGHATRCIPIIRYLIHKKTEVVIAAAGRPLALLKQEFPELEFVQFEGYNIDYSGTLPMALKMAVSVRGILKRIKEEHEELNAIVDRKHIDIVISDNRYGCHHPKTKNIFITHQLMIKAPVGEGQLHKKVLKYISNYDECWVPDVAGSRNLSGDLSHKYPLPANTFFIGPLSRFSSAETPAKPIRDVMAIVSGPEPQRSILEKLITGQICNKNLSALIVSGVPDSAGSSKSGGVQVVTHMNSNEMQKEMLRSRIIISRPGYSTAMDLSVLAMKAVFIPTPGQTEQQYLAEYYKKQNIAFYMDQRNFDLSEALEESVKYNGFELFTAGDYKERIDLLLK
ncbi:MAG: glycosyltransferase [Bacteroidia bacterium]